MAYEQIKQDRKFKEMKQEFDSDGYYWVSVYFEDGQEFHFEGEATEEFMKEKESVMLAMRGTGVSIN